MGNSCSRNKKKSDKNANKDNDIPESPEKIQASLVLKWEEIQKERNLETLTRLREDFQHRPDNFILNMLVVSTQFFRNFDKERREIANTIRNREKHFKERLSPYKRGVLYLGGYEEIAGTHVLYQDPDNFMLELPTRLQLFILQENIHVFGEDQLEELLTATYQDDEIPIYRMTEEPAKRHPGYVRLRASESIPGLSRSDTYEDLYSFLPKPDENEPDPVMDIRPIRRSSVISQDEFNDLYEVNTGFETSHIETDITDNYIQPSARRPSGVLPASFEWKKNSKHTQNKLTERRPSGVFPKMNPGMERVSLKSKPKQKFEPTSKEFDKLNELLSKIEEDGESEDEPSNSSGSKTNVDESECIYETLPLKDEHLTDSQNEYPTNSQNKYPTNSQNEYPTNSQNEYPTNSQNEYPTNSLNEYPTNSQNEYPPNSQNGVNSVKELSLQIQNECFLNKKIKLRSATNAYGIGSNSELRTYLSSNRYLDTFEEEFFQLLEILQKDYLYGTCEMQTPAIHVQDIIIEKQGPKFNTEYIPSILVERWPQCAFEWKWRSRKPKIDSDSQIIYKWPLEHKIHEVSEMGCNLVPIGFYNPREPTKTMEIEWQIQFTRAERALLKSLGHSQIRTLLLAEVLIRNHLGEKTQLRTQHLRYILFYMCEHNIRDWHEERLGYKLKAFLKSVYGCFSNENFPHYFVSKYNMIDSFPLKDLRFIQSTVKKMTENLPIYLMHTLHRLRMADEFYPRLDIKKLYKIVTPKSYHGNIAQSLIGIQAPISNEDSGSSDENSEDEEDIELKKKLKAEYQRRQDKGQTQQEFTPRKKGLNLEYKIQNLTDNRAEVVLKYFSDHFVEMARKSKEFQAYPQAYKYILLAGNMATLLEDYNCSQEAEYYREVIEQINSELREGIASILGSSGKMQQETQEIDEVITITKSNVPNWELKPQKEREKQPKTEKEEEMKEKAEVKKIGISSKNVAASLMAFQNVDGKKSSNIADDLYLPDDDSDLEMFESPTKKTVRYEEVQSKDLKSIHTEYKEKQHTSILKQPCKPQSKSEEIKMNGKIPRPNYIKPDDNSSTRKISDTPSGILRDLDFTLANVQISNFEDDSITSARMEKPKNTLYTQEEENEETNSIDNSEITKF